MLLKNAKIVNENFDIVAADILVNGDTIAKIAAPGEMCSCCTAGHEVLDFAGKLIMPGFVDIHIHGCAGADTGDATPEALETMSKYLASNGITSFCPTSMTVSNAELRKIFANVKACADKGMPGAQIVGINMEGPYISAAKKGAQALENIRPASVSEIRELNEIAGGLIKLVDLAPEEAGADEFITEMKDEITVSIAHTNANYEQAKHSFDLGINHATHLFNQMSGLTHRAPGVVGAIFESDTVSPEIICDGFHINPAVLRIAFAVCGEDRTCVISDSLKAAGCPDGEYDLGGQPVFVKDGKAFMSDGVTIAASTANIHVEFKNLISYGIPFKQVIKSCTINPAREIKEDKVIGSIAEGKRADFVVVDDNYDIVSVIVKGVKYC